MALHAQEPSVTAKPPDEFMQELHEIVRANLRANTRLVRELQKGTLDLRHFLRVDLQNQIHRRDNVAYHAAIVANMTALDVENGLRPKYPPELMRELLEIRKFQAGNASVEATGQFVAGQHNDMAWDFSMELARRVGVGREKLNANRYNIEPWPEVIALAKLNWRVMKESGNFVLGFARNFAAEEEHLIRDQAIYPALKEKYGFEDRYLGTFVEHLKLEETHSDWAEKALRLFATTVELQEQVREVVRTKLQLRCELWNKPFEREVRTRDGNVLV